METDSAIAKSENQKRVTQDSQRTADHSLQAMSPELPLRSRPGRWTLLSQTLARRRSSRGGLRSLAGSNHDIQSARTTRTRAAGGTEKRRCVTQEGDRVGAPGVQALWPAELPVSIRSVPRPLCLSALARFLLDMERQRADAARPAEVRRALKEVRHA